MALKKSELYSSLWQSCDELRGGMDASQYKDYVLVLLFVKYVSDKYAGQPYAPITIPPGASFADMVALKGKPDLTVGKQKCRTELIPPALVIAGYFATEQAAVEKLEAEIAGIQQALEELAEEHGGEGGLLEDAKNEKDKLTKASVTARLKEIKADPDAADERRVLGEYVALIEKEAAASAKLKEAQESLMAKVLEQYGRLSEDEIKTVVVDDKWLAALAAAVQGELDRVSQTLTSRIRQLAERYAAPLPQLTEHVVELEAKVHKHLEKMGFTA